jgi:L-asparaginase
MSIHRKQVRRRTLLRRTLSLVVGAWLLIGSAEAAELPQVVILATGGTIAGQQKKPGEAGYTAGQVAVDAIIAAVPELRGIAQVRGEQIASIGSQDMNDEVWLRLLRRIGELVNDQAVGGVVVTHGTDTIEETAFFLDLTLATDKPVVLVGAMRPATALGADGPLNLLNAVRIAAAPESRGRGVLVTLNEEIHNAREVTKTNTTEVQTFGSPNAGPVGLFTAGRLRYHRAPPGGGAPRFAPGDWTELPRVEIVYAHANMQAGLIEASARLGARGLVIAGVGNGNMSRGAMDALAALAKQGAVVVRSSRVGSGWVSRNVEVDDDSLGLVASQDLNPQKARILLQLALTQTSDSARVQAMFDPPNR